MNDTQQPGIGHNAVSSDQQIRENLIEAYRSDRALTDEIKTEAAALPAAITEDMIQTVSDFKKKAVGHSRDLDKKRTAEKEPYLRGGRAVDGFFNGLIGEIEKIVQALEPKLKAALQAKADRERREELEKAAAARKAAEERARREDEERQAKLQEEAAARKRAEEAEAAAKAEQERAQREIDEANARVAAAERAKKEAQERHARDMAEAEERRLAAEREAAAAKEGAAIDRARVDAEIENARFDEAAAEKARIEAEAKAEADRRAAEKLAAEKKAEAEVIQATGERNVTAANREARQAGRAAYHQEKIAAEASEHETAAVAKEDAVAGLSSAAFSKTRSDLGSLALLKDKWVVINVKPADLSYGDFKKLKPFLKLEWLQAAAQTYADTGARDLDFCQIVREQMAQVR